jgi:thioredoxin/glutathione reductase (selenoprotein)
MSNAAAASALANAASRSIVHVAGYSSCGFYRRAASVVASLTLLFPSKFQLVEHEFPTREAYREWLISKSNGDGGGFRDGVGRRPNAPGNLRATSHSSSPFCWLSSSSSSSSSPGTSVSATGGGGIDAPESTARADDVVEFIGGCDDTLEWCRKLLAVRPGEAEEVVVVGGGEGGEGEVGASTTGKKSIMVPDGHDPSHGYDYDLLVIGGGSGGLAASKEASRLGARVAVLDYVKPSPMGSTWGLGGTCVNVGCIPKKLMHNAALLTECHVHDLPHYGVGITGEMERTWSENYGSSVDNPMPSSGWETLRTNVQNHIRGLNFKYRVDLREKDVTYINALGKFVDSHTLEVVNAKGISSSISFSRCIIAVGGRPTPIDCPGGELSISSDDVFSLENDPGKVLCVGASYISLECAGFLRGIGRDVTVAVRSILLRGFDRECADMIGEHMRGMGINFVENVVPAKLERTDDGRIRVTMSDGTSDVYDTVLGAIGRTGDTARLGLENVGILPNPKNGKIHAVHEQTSVPNVYVIGDVMDGCPELTPVAIHAGRALVRRLFGLSEKCMDYRNVCTTVFTPLEYGTVGCSEDDAISEFGNDSIVVYHKYFVPLEWSISPSRSHSQGFCKAIVNRHTDRVLGLHYLGPNAGEVMQGFGTAMKLGCKFEDIVETVGIHPTTAEEFTTLR